MRPRGIEDIPINSILKKEIEANGFGKMTDVQQMCVPEMLKGKDVVVQSPTGTGKTMAFLAPILSAIYDRREEKGIVAMIITPTRELALQIKDVADLFGVGCECFIGGMNIEDDYERMKKEFPIVVGTPGRLLEIVGRDTKKFSRVRHAILDEADKLLGFGFEEKLLQLLAKLPKNRVTGLFSATINDSVSKLSMSSLRNPVSINVGNNAMPVALEYIVLSPMDKLFALVDIVPGRRCIVFFATCNEVDFFSSLLSRAGLQNICKIHGKIPQDERNRVYREFFKGNSLLFCTDVAARGIDFQDVDLVVHFDIPKEYSSIVHRSGRTARNGCKGESILFVMPNEKAYTEFLKLKGIPVAESSYKIKPSTSYSDIKSKIDSDLLNLSVKAFVSYIRSYKEHFVSYILDYKGLDFNSLAELFFLEKIPGMAELKNVKFEKFVKPEKTERKGTKPKKRIRKK
ncbi:DEAD box ATP-dependent RNA helicase [Encephalitozoon intestinalis ATCC 50506]|uniref:ATP-dependent RNA helicase n=1 Tax=Encephalitozoon intestinalis (strain ATCC 50506) TaxID=876142 RepID=E0S9K5_ENCIT|nr:DEAD box ATP-dependent RNA helicase [Encephalitozoon intestinalis ATCC 50506]ADM12390.1 DEAD box ATP-dependent RNA helicase [Encephalitozoon intestinalis ATCC 50506]UTX46222.1 helicase associated WITH SET1 protein 1 [Encephalitozoon intestinalis]